MKKVLIVIFIIFVVLLCGELFTSPKSIMAQRDGMNVWRVNHVFDLFHTEYLGPVNDTSRVVIVDKNKTRDAYTVHVTDGNRVTMLKSYDVYHDTEVGDTVDLVTSFVPESRHTYKTKYTVIK